MRQRTVDGSDHDIGIAGEELGVPLGILASRDDGQRFSVFKVALPVGEIQDDVEVVPSQETTHARAYDLRVDLFDVLVRVSVDLDSVLPLRAEEDRACRWGDVFQQHGQRKTLSQHPVASGHDGLGDRPLVFEDEVAHETVQSGQTKNVARAEETQNERQDLRREIEKGLDVRVDFGARLFLFLLLLQTCRLLRVQGEGLRGVYEQFLVG